MLKKQDRLTKAAFDEAFKNGRRYHSDPLTLIYRSGETFHGAVVVGKKVSKKAVTRNKLRRRIYNSLYTLSKEQDLSGTFIILSKPSALTHSYQELKAALTTLVGRIQNPS